MTTTPQGSLRLFRFAGIEVFLHWSWFLVALYEISDRAKSYSSPVWSVLEYLALFLIVTVHEFGHALACRQVGGRANRIVLWPLGGVAYVQPPPRPGATLWSIAAGPLVNVALLPILWLLESASHSLGWAAALPDYHVFLQAVWFINLALLIFNLLPIYPLDGGQILRALLWFGLGRARSLMVATLIGFVGVAGLILGALWMQSVWFGVIAVFILMNCWNGLRQARALSRILGGPRREGFACPACQAIPPIGEYWVCGHCHQPFDMFRAAGVCPHCDARFSTTMCLDCGSSRPVSEWVMPRVPA